jgi:hypothetical protein
LKPSAQPNPMPWQDSEVQMCYNIQVSHSSCGDLLDYLMACKYMSWSLQIGWS